MPVYSNCPSHGTWTVSGRLRREWQGIQQIPHPRSREIQDETSRKATEVVFVVALIWGLQFMQGVDLWLHVELVRVW